MYDDFVAWGQAYGLWATIALLCLICITQYMENARLKKALEESRKETQSYCKIVNEVCEDAHN